MPVYPGALAFLHLPMPETVTVHRLLQFEYSAIPYTPVACIATVSTRHDFSHPAL